MIKSQNGLRFKFQVSQVKNIEKVNKADKFYLNNSDNQNSIKNVFCGNIEVSAGISNARYSFSGAPNLEVSIVFGKKKHIN